jgi:hypothetical protein
MEEQRLAKYVSTYRDTALSSRGKFASLKSPAAEEQSKETNPPIRCRGIRFCNQTSKHKSKPIVKRGPTFSEQSRFENATVGHMIGFFGTGNRLGRFNFISLVMKWSFR